MECPICGGASRWIYSNLYKCYFCEMYFNDTSEGVLPQRLEAFTSIDKVREYAVAGISEEVKSVPSEEGIHPEMAVFIRRLSESLTPIYQDYPKNVQLDILRTRAEYRDQLTEVIEGKRDAQEWFDRTKTRTGLHRRELIQKIVDSLEGLTNPEAVAMREEYRQVLAGDV